MLVRDVANVIEYGTRVVISDDYVDLVDRPYEGGLFEGDGLADMEVSSVSVADDCIVMYVGRTDDFEHDALVRLSRMDYMLSGGADTEWFAVMMLAREVGAIAETAMGHRIGR